MSFLLLKKSVVVCLKFFLGYTVCFKILIKPYKNPIKDRLKAVILKLNYFVDRYFGKSSYTVSKIILLSNKKDVYVYSTLVVFSNTSHRSAHLKVSVNAVSLLI